MNGFVYVIKMGDTDYYKIGKTQNLKERLSTIQGSHPFDLKIVRSLQTEYKDLIEKRIHFRFAKNRVRGEWFRFNGCELINLFSILSLVTPTKKFDEIYLENQRSYKGTVNWHGSKYYGKGGILIDKKKVHEAYIKSRIDYYPEKVQNLHSFYWSDGYSQKTILV